jgi:2-haloacid dehalogenase
MGAAIPRETIDAFVFDAYGTLFDTAAPVVRSRQALGDRAERLTQVWRTKQLEYTWLRSLRGDYVDFWHVTGDGLDYAMATLGIEDLALRSRLMEAYLILDAYPDAAATLKRLKSEGLRTAILSNGSPSMLTAAVGHADLHDALDAVLSVDAVGIYKPHPSAYRLACDRFGVAPERICFVSGNGWDVSGAAHYGFKVVWMNRAGAQPERLPGAPVAVAETLAALPGLIGP